VLDLVAIYPKWQHSHQADSTDRHVGYRLLHCNNHKGHCSDARLFFKKKQANLRNKPNMSNLTEKQAQRAFGRRMKKKHKTSRLVKYKNMEENQKKQAQNEQIYTETRPSFVLE